MRPTICAYCMLHRYQTFKEVISNIRTNAGLDKVPFFSFSFKESYSEKKRRLLERDIENLSIEFINKKIPEFIKEKDLFYNKVHLDYVRTSFPKSRKNYLHMCEFLSDPSSTPNINNYDLAIRFDDDSWFKQKIDFDYNLLIDDEVKQIATSHTHMDKLPKQRETKIGLFEATIEYCNQRKIIPKYDLLAKSLKDKDLELFHKLPWTSGNFNIYKMSIFQTEEWQDWIYFIKKTGGIFKNRWGDIEIIGTFAYIYFEDPILNLDLFPDKYDQRKDNQSIIYFKRNIFIRVLSKLKGILLSNLLN